MDLLARLSGVAVLCVGDVMLDRFVGGAVRRISPESPVPVLSMTDATVYAGGAANVARNVASLGASCTIVGVVGADEAAAELQRALETGRRISPAFVVDPERPTTEKTRYIAQGQQILRTDREVSRPISPEVEERLISSVIDLIPTHQIVVLSDYAKGVLTPRVIAAITSAARERGLPVVVDPKSRDFSRYDGATLLTPNASEVQAATGIEPQTDELARAAADAVLETTQIDAILITRAEKGMTLAVRQGIPVHIPSRARQVADVVGAGDTVIATLALAIGAGGDLEQAARLANAAAGIVVGKRGTATVSMSELIAEMELVAGGGFVPASAKVFDRSKIRSAVAAWRRDGLRVGFTNGCFDLLHVGHVSILEFSRAHCDRLVVGVNSDQSVRRLKGEGRPVTGEADRARMLAALGVVDAVVIFDEDTPAALIEEVVPTVLVKGADYQVSEIVGADFVLGHGGEVLRYELVPGRSTTEMIRRARAGQSS